MHGLAAPGARREWRYSQNNKAKGVEQSEARCAKNGNSEEARELPRSYFYSRRAAQVLPLPDPPATDQDHVIRPGPESQHNIASFGVQKQPRRERMQLNFALSPSIGKLAGRPQINLIEKSSAGPQSAEPGGRRAGRQSGSVQPKQPRAAEAAACSRSSRPDLVNQAFTRPLIFSVSLVFDDGLEDAS